MKVYVINPNDAGQRLDKFIFKVTEGLPASLLYKGIRKNAVKLNSRRARPETVLKEGDEVKLWFADEFFGEKAPIDAVKEKPDVVFEDENILIVCKRPGMSCHPDEKQKNGTLTDVIRAYLFEKGEFDPENENSFSPALCNRIDRNTGGLVICAKRAEALRETDAAIRDRLFEKTYLALAHGKTHESGKLVNYLKKDSEKNTVSVFDAPTKGALTAICEYELVEYFKSPDVSLVKVRLLTGRTHQIRAQFSHAGHPLVGDGKYARTGGKNQLGFSHQALWSHTLTLHYPPESPLYYLDGKSFSAPVPESLSPQRLRLLSDDMTIKSIRKS
ncbi:MAG: RluA family pseudouridine synthase [Clostridia bacterium]|nr:RluA family pseudouridine synthase [Clostridia bacterium]